MANDLVYRFHAPRMIQETVGNETVAIDTETGFYFSLTGSGSLMMQMLATGSTIDQMTHRLALRFAIDPEALAPVIEDFVTQLLAEALIVPTTDELPVETEEEPEPVANDPFAPPVLEKFTDMNDLLLMDPIHDVSDQGWPRRA